ncbi:uncharacterized protein ARMOST_19362 [Armillaria ostoyae]|uniref:Uncharacterized protein n=1 Tax=Armillaria ostoyae TaxID=47428 RepID=A0A284S4G0_ARMOS|nr:uncharacterized protein ARMOST_19362 [Armillaria ostoyae]
MATMSAYPQDHLAHAAFHNRLQASCCLVWSGAGPQARGLELSTRSLGVSGMDWHVHQVFQRTHPRIATAASHFGVNYPTPLLNPVEPVAAD